MASTRAAPAGSRVQGNKLRRNESLRKLIEEDSVTWMDGYNYNYNYSFCDVIPGALVLIFFLVIP